MCREIVQGKGRPKLFGNMIDFDVYQGFHAPFPFP